MATTWEIEVATQAGPREPPLKISFPCAITFPNPGGGWKEGEAIIALYAYRLRGGHWRMDCCVQGRAGVPQGQLRRWAALPVTGVRGWGDRAEEHMSYGWLQMQTRAKDEQRRHLGVVAEAARARGEAVDVDAEDAGGEERDDGSSQRSSKSGRSKSPGRPRKGPKLAPKLAAKPPPAKQPPADVGAWVAAQAGAMPEWQKRAVAVLLLREKVQEAKQRAQGAERRATGAELEREHLKIQLQDAQTQAEAGRPAGGGGGGTGGGKGRGWGPVRSTLWQQARPGRPRQTR